jgi:hypothetical protein
LGILNKFLIRDIGKRDRINFSKKIATFCQTNILGLTRALFPDIASRIPPLEPNHVANPIVLDRKTPNLFIKRVGSAIARQARPPHHWFPGNFGHVERSEYVNTLYLLSPSAKRINFYSLGLSTRFSQWKSLNLLNLLVIGH